MVKAVYRDNSLHLNDPVNLQEGDEVDLKILPDLEIKKLKGAFRISETKTIEEIIESDFF